MKYFSVVLLLFYFSASFGQLGFSAGATLIDETHYSSDATSIISFDLNNDGKKELIVASRYDNTVMFYKNINNDIQHNPRVILYDNPQANYDAEHDLFAADLDADGLTDIIVATGYGGSIFWFKNLGSFNFSGPNTVANSLGHPSSVVAGDLDNDGDMDIVSGMLWDENVLLWLNDGSGTFSGGQVIQETDYGVEKVKLFDLDNNGTLDLISAQEDGTVYWKKNLGAATFGPNIYVTGGADDGPGFDFIKANGDNFYDVVYCASYDDKVKICYNLAGTGFSATEGIVDNNIADPTYLVAKDVDSDGLTDIVVSRFTNDAIGWYKNNNGSFSALNNVSSNVSNPRVFIVEDLDSDGKKEIITSSYLSSTPLLEKVAIFEYNYPAAFTETVLNFYFSAVCSVKVADLNNDGNNDIISGYRGILWNENIGNADFTSQKLITSPTGPAAFYWDMELIDLDSDGFKDIIATSNTGLDVFRNNTDETFTKLYSASLPNQSRELEMADIDNDGDLDILLSVLGSGNNLGKIINLGNFNFEAVQFLNFTTYGYKPNKIRCADMDNDGDQDIVVSSTEYSRIQMLINDGTGNFTYSLVRDSLSTNCLVLTDIENDGYVDIISAGGDSYSAGPVYSIKNNGDGSFGLTNIFDYQNVNTFEIADINNDGFNDVVGASYEYYGGYDEKVFSYLNNSGTLDTKHIIESLGDAVSLGRSVAVGDLNNDNKIDVVSGYYFINTVKYFVNTSELSAPGFNVPDVFALHPNPAKEAIYWSGDVLKNVCIFSMTGQLVLDINVEGNQTINIGSLSKGLYIFQGTSDNGIRTRKLVIE